MSELLNLKLLLLSSVYGTAVFLLLLFQQANDWASQMPDTTLAGIGLLMAALGGLMSWLWEKKQKDNASLRTSVTFAIGIGVMVGLLTYDSLCVSRKLVAAWLAVLMASGFSNQMLWGMVAIVLRKKVSKIFNIEASTDEQPERTEN